MATPARDESLQDKTYLPQEDTAEIIDFLSALRDRGHEPAHPRPRLTGPDGRSVELPEPMFDVLLQVTAAMKAGLAVTVAPHHLTRQRSQAELAFADMVADTERLGLYDADPAEVKAALKAARRKAED